MTDRLERLPALRRPPTLETLFVGAFALLGLRMGLRAISDNSAFVHIRTGIDIVDGLGIPRRDPYSFTARGEPWIVQSWLPSVVYGALERIGGLALVVLLNGALYATCAWLMASLARTGSGARTAVAGAVTIGIGMAYWAPRPLAFGLVAMAFTVVVIERNLAPWLLVPTAWLWVNSHGSFPLGALWLVLLVVTGRRSARRPLAWFVAGTVLSVLNPIGWRLLLFPLTILAKRENFARVLEWRPPTPRSPLAALALVCLAVAVALVVLGVVRGRLRVRDAVPAAVFVGLGLVAQRNLAPAAIVLAPVVGEVLRAPHRDTARLAVNRGFAAVLAAAAAVFVGFAVASDPVHADDSYPPDAAFAATGAAERVVTTDIVGGYRILRLGRSADVFVDDRYDMYPEQVIRDYLSLLDGDARSAAVLARHRADAVVWPRREELARLLDRSATWRRTFDDGDWAVWVRT